MECVTTSLPRLRLIPSLAFTLLVASGVFAQITGSNLVASESFAPLPAIEAVPAPVSAGLAAIVADRDGPLDADTFTLYRWDRFPTILIFDMADFEVQNRMFSRLAFYLEKNGYRGRLLSDAQLEGKHGWNAHDYGAEGLAAFFSAAARASFLLDPEELLLEDIAIREGILVRQGESIAAGEGGVLSICRNSSYYERRLLLAHESYHGIFFASAEYSRYCFEVWSEASPEERRFMRTLLWALSYDSSDRYLAVNEFQAYLLQQPSSMAAAYFKRVAAILRDPKEAPPVELVVPQLLGSERKLESFLKANYGIAAGGAYTMRTLAR